MIGDCDGLGGLGGGVFELCSVVTYMDLRGKTGGGALPRSSEASETDREREPPGLLEAPIVPLRGMGTGYGVRGFGAGSSRDITRDSDIVVDDVTEDDVSETDQLSINDENVCLPLKGRSGGVESSFVGDISVMRSIFLGVEDGSCAPLFNPRLGRDGALGDKTSP